MFKKFVLSCLILTSCCLSIRTAQAWEFRAGVRGFNILGSDGGDYPVTEFSKFAISFADLAAYYNVIEDISLGLSYSFNKHLFISNVEDDYGLKRISEKFNWHEIGLDFIWDFFKVSKFSISARTTVNLVNIINLEVSFRSGDFIGKNDYDLKVQLPFNFRVGTGANLNITDNLILYSDLLVQFSKLKLNKIKVSYSGDLEEYARIFDVEGEIVSIDDVIPEKTVKIKIYGIAMSVGVRYSI